MQVKITVHSKNTESIEMFIYNYLPDYMFRKFINSIDSKRLSLFDQTFGIDSFSIMKYALKHLLITKVRDDTYLIKIDNTLKYNKHMLMDYITLITYGTRQIRGYSILLDIFKDITNNMWSIYNAWQLGLR